LIHEVKNKLNIRGSSIHRQWGLRLKVFQALADTPDRSEIREAIRALCAEFDDAYWADKDLKHEFPFEFAAAIADGGWLGIAMPAEFGGSGLGVTEAAIVLQEIGHSAGTLAACSAIHVNIFGLHSIVKHGSKRQLSAWLPPVIDGSCRACLGVTEPDAGLDTTKIITRAERTQNGYVVNGQKYGPAPPNKPINLFCSRAHLQLMRVPVRLTEYRYFMRIWTSQRSKYAKSAKWVVMR
jgi:hypothetical protein